MLDFKSARFEHSLAGVVACCAGLDITLFVLLLGLRVVAQTGPEFPPQSGIVIRTTTRLLQLDVVVSDSSGHAVRNLTASDFTLLEDGKPQKVSFVSLVDGDGAPSTPPPKLPPYVTTNRPEYQAREGPAVILVLDAVNTPTENQVYVRQQMLRYLAKRFDPSVRLAVLVLGSKLRVVQDFTQDPHILEVALQG